MMWSIPAAIDNVHRRFGNDASNPSGGSQTNAKSISLLSPISGWTLTFCIRLKAHTVSIIHGGFLSLSLN